MRTKTWANWEIVFNVEKMLTTTIDEENVIETAVPKVQMVTNQYAKSVVELDI